MLAGSLQEVCRSKETEDYLLKELIATGKASKLKVGMHAEVASNREASQD